MDMGYNMGLSMVGTLGLALTIYYVCNSNTSVGNSWNFRMGVSGMVFGFLGIPVFAFIAHKLGKRHAMMCVLGSGILIFAASWWLYTPKIVWLQVFASGLNAFIGAGYWTLSGSIGADVMDYDELEGGRRREGSFVACGSWINKVGMAIGAGVSFFILGWIGFDSSLPQQTDHTITMIRVLFLAIPIAGLAFSMISLTRFPLTHEKMMEIRTALEARRGKV
jgi:GPH family glycoside/pentoside/hexuronide:cation symporter